MRLDLGTGRLACRLPSLSATLRRYRWHCGEALLQRPRFSRGSMIWFESQACAGVGLRVWQRDITSMLIAKNLHGVREILGIG
jgi:hypothetical protein